MTTSPPSRSPLRPQTWLLLALAVLLAVAPLLLTDTPVLALPAVVVIVIMLDDIRRGRR